MGQQQIEEVPPHIVDLYKCEGDTFMAFRDQYVESRIRIRYKKGDCGVYGERLYTYPNNEEFTYTTENLIEISDTNFVDMWGYDERLIYYFKYVARESTQIIIKNISNIDYEYEEKNCDAPDLRRRINTYIYNIHVYPKNPKPNLSAQTITTNPNAPEIVQITASGCDSNEGTFWSSSDPNAFPYYNSTNVIHVSNTYDCLEYKVKCNNRFCPQYPPNWSDPLSASDFRHTQNNPGYSPTFSDYLNNQKNKSVGKPEYTYRRQLACIQQKARDEYNKTGENGWAGGFTKHLFDSFATKDACDLSANYSCKYATTQIGCLRETGDLIHGVFELGPGFFSYQPNGNLTEGIASWNQQHDGFLTHAVASCFDELKQDPNFYNPSMPTDNTAAIDAMQTFVITSAIWSRWVAQFFYKPKLGYSTIQATPNQAISVDIQNQIYGDIPSPLIKDQLFSQQVFNVSQLKVTAENTFFLKTNSTIQLTVQQNNMNFTSSGTTYQLNVDPSVATITNSGLLTIHSTREPLVTGRFPLYVTVTNNGLTGIGQFAIYDTDDDGDMIADTYEQRVGLNPIIKNDLKSDSDADDLLDIFEVNLRTDPLKKDTDGDGFNDLEEYLRNTVPTNANSFPLIINSISSGDWNNPSTWSCSCIPTSADDVIINTAHTVLLDSTMSEAVCRNLELLGTFSIQGGSLIINGNRTFVDQNNVLPK
ncbi:hypothetical protein GCM10007390_21070 [Persicitalea jodogahamensis]|uniref:Uncharacterized protein n=2 Tax=Persicitalea jodogahamensis TaxID=402147 RepID=A0A8J3D3F0_9BACT|nr:hypothetical protein [Persicitalea jodogahamensis]GHB67548.1 hypothetical protein GCM10007390_21070 [Persicitalea jodogahamensis]